MGPILKQNNLLCNNFAIKNCGNPKNTIRAAHETLFSRFPRRGAKPGRAKRGGEAARAGGCRAARRGPLTPNPQPLPRRQARPPSRTQRNPRFAVELSGVFDVRAATR